MDVREKLNQRLDSWRLLDHPFYRSWNAGELPVAALKSYAEEYGAFIAQMPLGWETLEDSVTAREEVEHAQLWEAFAVALGTRIGVPQLPEVQALIRIARESFSDPIRAMGALYAFEVQQPATAESKLAGLREFYRLSDSAGDYFEAHRHNQHEAEKLLAKLQSLTEEQLERALEACEEMSRALWDALTGIYNTNVVM